MSRRKIARYNRGAPGGGEVHEDMPLQPASRNVAGAGLKRGSNGDEFLKLLERISNEQFREVCFAGTSYSGLPGETEAISRSVRFR